jgi:hypothetical protein
VIWLPATLHDCDILATHMRLSDVIEVRTAAITFGRMDTGWSLSGEIQFGLENGPCWSLWDSEGLVGMAGVASCQPNPEIGAIWFLGTDLADLKWRAMTRATKRIKPFLEQGFSAVGNLVPANMHRRIAWLEYLGFDISKSKANVPDGYVSFWSHPKTAPKTVLRP